MIKLEVVVILFFRAHKVTTFFHIISINMLYFMLFNIKYLDIAILWKWCSWFFFVKTLVSLKYIRTFAPLLTKSTSEKEVLERWQSGRLRRSWKPLYREVPGVRIPVSPLGSSFLLLSVFIESCSLVGNYKERCSSGWRGTPGKRVYP